MTVLLKPSRNPNLNRKFPGKMELLSTEEDLQNNQLFLLNNEIAILKHRIEYLEKLLLLNEPPAESNRNMCAFCQEAHPIRTCKYFRYLQISDRWSVTKQLGLCFRCLDNDNRHLGKNCPKTRICRIKGCRLLHDRLLHDPDRRKLRVERYHATNLIEPSISDRGIQNASGDILTGSDFPGPVDSVVRPTPSAKENNEVTHFMDNLDSFEDLVATEGQCNFRKPPGGDMNVTDDPECSSTEVPSNIEKDIETSVACDGKIDSQQMDELNRLAVLAEITTDLPFEMVFSGSCRDKSHLLRREYVTFAPSGGDDSPVLNEHFTKYGEAEMTPAPSGGSLDILDSFNVRSAVHGKQLSPTEAPFDHGNDTASLDSFDGTELKTHTWVRT